MKRIFLICLIIILAACTSTQPEPIADITPSETTTLPTKTNTPTITQNPTSADTPTITPTPTITLTPTITMTPTVTPTPTIVLPEADQSGCIPSDTLREWAYVYRVIDGDTIKATIEGIEFDIRLLGIDAPTLGEHYSWESVWFVEELILDKWVILIKDVSETDQYDRLLRYIIVDDRFVNYDIVHKGYGIARNSDPDNSCSITFQTANTSASTNLLGLFEPTPTPLPRYSGPVYWNCDFDIFECTTLFFPTRKDAQACYEYCMSEGYGDVHNLDPDGNESACDNLP